jgi:hypothetical protein
MNKREARAIEFLEFGEFVGVGGDWRFTEMSGN